MNDSIEDKELIHQPHDKIFKSMMQDKKVAQDFCKQHLPEHIKQLVDLNTLELVNASFIDERFKASESDILYRVKTRERRQTAYIYILAEHLSNPDRWIPFRLVKYLCDATDQHLKLHPQNKVLPLIIPIIYYNGDKPYPYTTCFFDLFGEHKDLAKEVFNQGFKLIDLNSLPDDILRQHQWAGLMELMMKQAKRRNLLDLWRASRPLIQWMLEQGGEKLVGTMLIYHFNVSQDREVNKSLDSIRSELKQFSNHAQMEKVIMTAAEQLKQMGWQEGVQQGMQQGILRGKQEGLQAGVHKVAVNMLKELKDINLVSRLTGLSVEELEKIK